MAATSSTVRRETTTGRAPDPPAPRPRRRTSIPRTIAVVAAAASCALFLLPVVWLVLTSFKQAGDIYAVPPKWLFEPTLENYTSYFQQAQILPRYLNTVIIAVGSCAVAVTVGTMCGYGLSRLRIRGAGVIGGLILATRAVPPIALAVPMFLVGRAFGLLDTHTLLILAYTTFLIPYVMLLMRSFFRSLPKELEESAMLDGCSRFGAFARVIVPSSLPGLAATLVYCLILAWNELLFALVLTKQDAVTIPVAIQGMAADTEKGALWGPLTAIGTLTVIPMIVFALLVQKHLITGLAGTGSKE